MEALVNLLRDILEHADQNVKGFAADICPNALPAVFIA
jgi:hypothetical protein